MNFIFVMKFLSIKYQKIFLFTFIFSAGAVFAGPKNEFSKQEKCNFETAKFQRVNEHFKSEINIYPDERICVQPTGKIVVTVPSDEDSDDYLRGQLNKTVKTIGLWDDGETYILEWKQEANQLIRYSCLGNSLEKDFNCYGTSKKEIMGISRNSLSKEQHKEIVSYFERITFSTNRDSYENPTNKNLKEQLRKESLMLINLINAAIKNNPKDINYYTKRYDIKAFLGDYRGALLDINKAKNIDPTYLDSNDGFTTYLTLTAEYKYRLKDYNGALRDSNLYFAKNTETNPYKTHYSNTLFIRALAKYKLGGDNKEICREIKKAAELGHSHAKDYLEGKESDPLVDVYESLFEREEGSWCKNMLD
mgnify:CR=1 FL=1